MTLWHELYAPLYIGPGQEPKELYTQIQPGLFMGGTGEDEEIFSPPEPHYGPDPRGFDAVLTLYAWAQPFGWDVEELRFGFADADPAGTDMTRVVAAARWAHERWTSGDTVLIRCQAGLNRSGLLTAMVLMLDGWHVSTAIRTIRDRRAPMALFNEDFVDWLVAEAPRALATPPKST